MESIISTYFKNISTYQSKQVLYKEGDEPEYVYIIKEGIFGLVKQFTVERDPNPKIMQSVFHSEDIDAWKSNKVFKSEIVWTIDFAI